jgi:hypothetical protein
MFVWWGQELITIYNDAYKIIAGDKPPWSIGQVSVAKVGRRFWDDLSPLAREMF